MQSLRPVRRVAELGSLGRFAPAMRSLSFICVLLMAGLASQAQTPVYSVAVYSMGRAYEHQWTLGNGATRIGFEQYRQYQDASGRDLCVFSDVQTKSVASPRYTGIYCGPVQFRVRGPAWFAVCIFALGIASLLLLVIVGFGRIRRHQTHAHNAA